jgi:hypothetical protein
LGLKVAPRDFPFTVKQVVALFLNRRPVVRGRIRGGGIWNTGQVIGGARLARLVGVCQEEFVLPGATSCIIWAWMYMFARHIEHTVPSYALGIGLHVQLKDTALRI